MFPFSVLGSLRFNSDLTSQEHLLREVKNRIAACKPTGLAVSGSTVTFTAGLLRPVTSANRLVTIRRGSVDVSVEGAESVVSYRLDFRELAVAGTVFSVLLAGAFPFGAKLPVFVAFWLFLVGGNCLFGVVQFKDLLREAASAAGKRVNFPL